MPKVTPPPPPAKESHRQDSSPQTCPTPKLFTCVTVEPHDLSRVPCPAQERNGKKLYRGKEMPFWTPLFQTDIDGIFNGFSNLQIKESPRKMTDNSNSDHTGAKK